MSLVDEARRVSPSLSISVLRKNHVILRRERTLDDVDVSVHSSVLILESSCVLV